MVMSDRSRSKVTKMSVHTRRDLGGYARSVSLNPAGERQQISSTRPGGGVTGNKENLGATPIPSLGAGPRAAVLKRDCGNSTPSAPAIVPATPKGAACAKKGPRSVHGFASGTHRSGVALSPLPRVGGRGGRLTSTSSRGADRRSVLASRHSPRTRRCVSPAGARSRSRERGTRVDNGRLNGVPGLSLRASAARGRVNMASAAPTAQKPSSGALGSCSWSDRQANGNTESSVDRTMATPKRSRASLMLSRLNNAPSKLMHSTAASRAGVYAPPAEDTSVRARFVPKRRLPSPLPSPYMSSSSTPSSSRSKLKRQVSAGRAPAVTSTRGVSRTSVKKESTLPTTIAPDGAALPSVAMQANDLAMRMHPGITMAKREQDYINGGATSMFDGKCSRRETGKHAGAREDGDGFKPAPPSGSITAPASGLTRGVPNVPEFPMTDVAGTQTPARHLGDAASVWAPSDNPDGKKSRRVSWQVEPCVTPGKACNAPIPGQCQDLKICCPPVPGSLSPAWRTSVALQPCPGDGGGSPAQFRPQGEMGELDSSFSSIETAWSLPSVDDRERQPTAREEALSGVDPVARTLFDQCDDGALAALLPPTAALSWPVRVTRAPTGGQQDNPASLPSAEGGRQSPGFSFPLSHSGSAWKSSTKPITAGSGHVFRAPQSRWRMAPPEAPPILSGDGPEAPPPSQERVVDITMPSFHGNPAGCLPSHGKRGEADEMANGPAAHAGKVLMPVELWGAGAKPLPAPSSGGNRCFFKPIIDASPN